MSLLESVPNVSEGRRETVVDRLAAAARRGGARLLDRSSDEDHHRSVLTLAGDARELEDSLLALYGAAIEEIDLRVHRGVHPRIGAVDVVPFVPLAGSSMEDAAVAARRLGARVARRFALPVFLYGEASERRRPLAELRRGGLEGLAARLGSPGWEPDFGPAELHPTAGATAIGARGFLIAYNVVLATGDARVARRIARRVREAGGGLAAVRALGFPLASHGLVQVSMNLVDFRRTSIYEAHAAVAREAKRRGVEVVESEIVGLVPEAALAGGDPASLRLAGFSEDQVLESRLRRAGL